MPITPKRTRKQQKQQYKAYLQEVKEVGAQQDFEGAPIWNDWVKQQHEAKKRNVGVTRRLGRTVVEAAAVSILYATAAPGAVTEYRHQASRQKAERLQKVVDHSNSAEALPATDLRKLEKSRLRRLGRSAMSVVNRSNKKSLSRTSQKAERLAAQAKTNRSAKMGPIEAWASNKIEHIDNKRHQTKMRRVREFDAKKQETWHNKVNGNYELKQEFISKQKQRDRQHEVGQRVDRYREMQAKGDFVISKFTGHDPQSLSKALPRKPEFQGSYDVMAKSSLERAAAHRNVTGSSIPLLGKETLASVIKDSMPLTPTRAEYPSQVVDQIIQANMPQPEDATNWDYVNNRWRSKPGVYKSREFTARNELLAYHVDTNQDHVSGVASALWKMGFVEFDPENTSDQGNKAGMNDAVQWSQGDDGTTYASLSFNPENELHRIIAGDQADPSNARIQLAINDSNPYAPEMNVSFIEQPALVHA